MKRVPCPSRVACLLDPCLLVACVSVLVLATGCGRNAAGASAAQPGKTLTAADQSETPDDIAITRRIRQSLLADERLSLAAKNVAVITARGQVTLRGRVGAVREKAEIGVRAREVAGTTRVDNQIEVVESASR